MNAINACVIAQIESSCGSNFKFPEAFILLHLPAYVTGQTKQKIPSKPVLITLLFCLETEKKDHFDCGLGFCCLQWCWFSQFSSGVVAIMAIDCPCHQVF